MNNAVVYALGSALLFGISTPLAKWLVGVVSPLQLAGLLYAGSGLGLALVLALRRMTQRSPEPLNLPRGSDWWWLAAATLFGGVIGPVALTYGLSSTSAAAGSLLLNLEAVFTATFAWFVFRENFDRRIALGMVAIVAGGVLLVWNPAGEAVVSAGSLLIGIACVCWALDNNLTRKVSGSDAVILAAIKGTVAGGVNLALAAMLGSAIPPVSLIAAAALVGLLGYGVSLVLFILALRGLGTARTGAYFSVAPFFGAALASLFEPEAMTWHLGAAAGLMALGVWLHVTERHEHLHTHEAVEHDHPHTHDAHHGHEHIAWDGTEPHSHRHVHVPLRHGHAHFPDLHHRHDH